MASLDIGSTAIKACVFDFAEQGVRLELERSLPCALVNPQARWYEHDLVKLEAGLQKLLGQIPPDLAISCASAMHGLVLLDEKHEPLCNAISWADNRSTIQAQQLSKDAPLAQARTGTPLHPMAWPSKLLWVKERKPDWWQSLSRVTDLKSFALERITGLRLPLDVSSASATGLWNQETQDWDEDLCGLLGLAKDLLPEVALEPQVWEFQGRTFHLGAGDGPLGNLGTGAVTPSAVAISLGTSGAVRTFVSHKEDLDSAFFRYHLQSNNWVEGGAISNGSSVLEWLRSQEDCTVEQLFDSLAGVGPGADGLRVYPYFKGERAPFWRAGVQSRLSGKKASHGFAELTRATIEGVAYCLNRLLRIFPSVNGPLRCTGGMFASPTWCQLLADVTGHTVAVSPISQATSLGAALLTLPSALEISQELPTGKLVDPNEETHQIYRDLYEQWADGDEASLS